MDPVRSVSGSVPFTFHFIIFSSTCYHLPLYICDICDINGARVVDPDRSVSGSVFVLVALATICPCIYAIYVI